MKKTVALILALSMVFALCGCGSEGKQANQVVQEPSVTDGAPTVVNATDETEEQLQPEEVSQTEEETYQTITEYGVSIQIPNGWSWSIPNNTNSSTDNVYYNFTSIDGDSSKTMQIGFTVSDLFSSRSYDLSDSDKYKYIGSLMQSFDSSVTEIKCSNKDNTYIGTGTFSRSGCEGRLTVIVNSNTNIIVSVAALEAPEMTIEYTEAYEALIKSVSFS